jgi:hypothetical protein
VFEVIGHDSRRIVRRVVSQGFTYERNPGTNITGTCPLTVLRFTGFKIHAVLTLLFTFTLMVTVELLVSAPFDACNWRTFERAMVLSSSVRYGSYLPVPLPPWGPCCAQLLAYFGTPLKPKGLQCLPGQGSHLVPILGP